MAKNEVPDETNHNGMTAVITKDLIRSDMKGLKSALEFKNNALPQGSADAAPAGDVKKADAFEVIKGSGKADISKDIEKDINIDVSITNNTSSPVQYTSNITINYYNYEAERQTDSKAKSKAPAWQLPPDFVAKLDKLKAISGLNETELTRMAYDLLIKKFETERSESKS